MAGRSTRDDGTARSRSSALAAAIWGFAIAISLLPFWLGPPPPGQLPGFATSMGLDARAPMRFVLGLILIPLLWTFALRPLLDDPRPRRHARLGAQRIRIGGDRHPLVRHHRRAAWRGC